MTPGSVEAIFNGCTCPASENGNGAGYRGMEGVYIYTSQCPVHDDERIARHVAEIESVWGDSPVLKSAHGQS